MPMFKVSNKGQVPIIKSESPARRRFENWCLEISVEFGAWDLELGELVYGAPRIKRQT